MGELYSEMFWLSLGGMIFGFLGLTIRFCLKSKCDKVDCFGVHIHRRVELELNDEDNNNEKI